MAETKKRVSGKPFVKGDKRINRRGVPKGLLEIHRANRLKVVERLTELLAEPPAHQDPGSAATNLDQLLMVAVADAQCRGAVGARVREWVLEQICGRPPQAVEATGPEGGPIRMVWDIPAPAREREQAKQSQK